MYNAVTAIKFATIIGFEDYFSNKEVSFENTRAFSRRFMNSFTSAQNILIYTDNEAELKGQSDALTKKIVDKYLNEKAEIIKNELTYAVNNYDESYFNHEDSVDSIVIPQTTLPSELVNSAVLPEENTTFTQIEPTSQVEAGESITVPKNIEAAQQILKNASGLDFLRYAALVRENAFYEKSFLYDIELNRSYYTIQLDNYTYGSSSAKKEIAAKVNDAINNNISDLNNSLNIGLQDLEENQNLKYYITDRDNKVYTNLNGKPDINDIKNYTISVYFDNNKIKQVSQMACKSNIESTILNSNGGVLCLFLSENLEYNDDYKNIKDLTDGASEQNSTYYIICFALSLVMSIGLLILFMIINGKKSKTDQPKTIFVDAIPTDIHLLLTLGLIGAIFLITVSFANEQYNEQSSYYSYSPIITQRDTIIYTIAATITYIFGFELLSSIVRIKKCKKSWFGKMLISRFIIFIIKMLKKLFNKLRILFSYKPAKLRYIILYSVAYVLINVILGVLTGLFIPLVALLIIFNCYCLFFAINYLHILDKIIVASMNNEDITIKEDSMPKTLKLLYAGLKNSNEAAKEAIAKAVRDEQMKTELITNVSHDLKTPLTSLINYSDLLSKCDIENEDAKKYIGVINNQSVKLKRLIEDLIEASKISTGNVTLNKSILNLTELSSQVIGEFAPDLEKNDNEIIFTSPDVSPFIVADGAKTYRIFANLLSNAKKYSATGTRVYINVFSDDSFGYFEIKNISSEPLNISPEELTERFVRGDKSRSKEGNGLGLSIAKDLCTLQEGDLKIAIDGDLFKATVALPIPTKTTP